MTSSTDQISREIGERLRRAREEAGISVRDLAVRTRIASRHISALEEGDFASLRGFIFVRGFVGSICRELGQDPGELLGLLKTVEPGEPSPLPPLQPLDAIRMRPERGARSSRSGSSRDGRGGGRSFAVLLAFYAVVAGGMAFLAMVMVGVVTPGARGEYSLLPAGTASGAAETREAVTPLPAAPVSSASGFSRHAATPPIAAPAASTSAPQTAAAASAEAPYISAAAPMEAASPRPAPAGDLRLRIIATEKTWLKVQADEQPSQEMTLAQDTEAEFVGRDHFTLTIGNAGGVTLDLNGRLIGPPGSPGQVISNYVLTRDDL